MSDQSSDEAHDPPPTAVADGVDVQSDQGTNGGSSESNISTSSAQTGIEQSMLDVIKQLRELNSNILKLNSKIDRLQYLVIGSYVRMKMKKIILHLFHRIDNGHNYSYVSVKEITDFI
jgi:hypothetical protein